MPIVINPSVSQVAAQGATTAPAVVLQPGSVISAQVLQVLGNDTVQIAIGGQPIDVVSQVPLQPGQTLQLAVSQSADGIRLAVVDQQAGASANQGPTGAVYAAATLDTVTLAPDVAAGIAAQTTSAVVAPKITLTPQEALAVSAAAQSAATQQTSLAMLFANLGVASGLDDLPPQVQQAVAQLLAQRTSLDQNLTGNDIKQAFQNSGLFLEASLASGSVSSSAATPDLKAALIVLRQVLTTSLSSATATQGFLATQGGAAPTVAVPRGAAAPAASVQGTPPQVAAVPQNATQPTAAVQPGVPTPAVVAQDATPAAPVVPQATTPATIVLEQGAQPLIQGSSQPVTITVVPETPATASPSLAPLLAPEIAAPQASLQASLQGPLQASLQGAASPVAQDVLNFSTLGQIILPASAPADAAARAASSAALNLLQEALQAGPPAAGNPTKFVLDDSVMLSLLPAVTGARTSKVDDAEFVRTNVPPPPISGALPAAQPVLPATLVSNSPAETAMHHLLADTDGAIARQTLLQVASLPDRVDATGARVDPGAPRWNFEIPFATPQGTAMAQFEISRDGGGSEAEAAKRVWRARFSLDVEPAGPVHALISLSGERTSVRMWAERPATAAQLRAGAAQLGQALGKAELQPGDIVIRDGAPVQTASARAGHFLDRAL
jgi:Flagellar hook-length control protein FliK